MSCLECFSGFYALTFFLLFLAIVYFVGTYNHNYFANQGVPYERPWPVLGNTWKFLFGIRKLDFVMKDLYEQFSDSKVFGFFEFMNPIYVLRDPELIKKVCIKDFDHFVNHRGQFDENADSIFAKSLFSIHDAKWKNMRTILSPAFTGSKMRQMFTLMVDYCDKMSETMQMKGKNGKLEMEMKDLFQRIGNDIVATCAFGIEVNSIENPDNEFIKQGKLLTKLDGLQGLKFLGFSSFPKLMKLLGLSLFKKETIKFFSEIVTTTINYREKHNVVRHDMIDLLIQAKKQELKFEEDDKKYSEAGFATVEDYHDGKVDKNAIKWTDDDLIAQCTIFFFAGFDTTAVLGTFLSYEIAANPDVQEKLVAEIDEVRERLGGKNLDYESLQKMKYMDMVVSETLRKWVIAIFLDRLCNKAYVFENSDGKKVHLKVGDSVWIPNQALHNDPQYYPDPEKFIPERFSSENKGKIDPATFLTFGIGPRNCIGSRFALMESKAIIFYLLSKFRFELSPKLQIPLKLKHSALNPTAANGMWLNFVVRDDI